MEKPIPPQLMTVREVAAELRIGVSSVWRHVRSGALPAPIKVVGATRWRRADIEQLLDGEEAA